MSHINSLNYVIDSIWHLGEFLFLTVFMKYVLVHWIADRMKSLFTKMFLRTERDMAIWLHYRNQARNKGHRHDTPIDCQDDTCKLV